MLSQRARGIFRKVRRFFGSRSNDHNQLHRNPIPGSYGQLGSPQQLVVFIKYRRIHNTRREHIKCTCVCSVRIRRVSSCLFFSSSSPSLRRSQNFTLVLLLFLISSEGLFERIFRVRLCFFSLSLSRVYYTSQVLCEPMLLLRFAVGLVFIG